MSICVQKCCLTCTWRCKVPDDRKVCSERLQHKPVIRPISQHELRHAAWEPHSRCIMLQRTRCCSTRAVPRMMRSLTAYGIVAAGGMFLQHKQLLLLGAAAMTSAGPCQMAACGLSTHTAISMLCRGGATQLQACFHNDAASTHAPTYSGNDWARAMRLTLPRVKRKACQVRAGL